jgi:hypothetical protein
MHFKIKEGDGRAYLREHLHEELWEGGMEE